MTPKAIVAQENTAERPRKTTRKIARGAVLENQSVRYMAARRVIAEDGITIQHFRLQSLVDDDEILVSHTGGVTVAFRKLESDSFVEIATSICSDKDVYDRKVGTILAVEQFDNLRRIRMPLFGAHPADAVEHLFRDYLTFTDED